MLHLPGVVDPESVGEFDLIERVLEELLLLAVAPGLGQLMFVEDAESHVVFPSAAAGSDSV